MSLLQTQYHYYFILSKQSVLKIRGIIFCLLPESKGTDNFNVVLRVLTDSQGEELGVKWK